ncbi:hypothetical protein SO802_032551, partial [Lithocarpus litseifolius]
ILLLDLTMISGRCAACKIYGASNIGKMLQQLPSHLRFQAADTSNFEAQYRLQDHVYGCVGIISQLRQQINSAESQVAKIQSEISLLNSKLMHKKSKNPKLISILKPIPTSSTIYCQNKSKLLTCRPMAFLPLKHLGLISVVLQIMHKVEDFYAK